MRLGPSAGADSRSQRSRQAANRNVGRSNSQVAGETMWSYTSDNAVNRKARTRSPCMDLTIRNSNPMHAKCNSRLKT
jgi:hypothetical protein